MKAQRSIVQISFAFLILFSLVSVGSVSVKAQALNAGTVTGVGTDPNNAVVPKATVTIAKAVTSYTRTTNTDAEGAYLFIDVPTHRYPRNAIARSRYPV